MMRKEWQGRRSTHHDVVLTIPVRRVQITTNIRAITFKPHSSPYILCPMSSNGCHPTAAKSMKVRASQKKKEKNRHMESENYTLIRYYEY